MLDKREKSDSVDGGEVRCIFYRFIWLSNRRRASVAIKLQQKPQELTGEPKKLIKKALLLFQANCVRQRESPTFGQETPRDKDIDSHTDEAALDVFSL